MRRFEIAMQDTNEIDDRIHIRQQLVKHGVFIYVCLHDFHGGQNQKFFRRFTPPCGNS